MVEQPIRNRQVASSTLALGSKISFQSSELAESLNCPRGIRCKIVASSKFFAERIHCVYLRFIHAFDVDVLGYPDIAVAQDRLDRFVVHAKRVQVGCNATSKCVPAMPEGK